MFLAGDIGGTNTRVAFFEGDASHLDQMALEIYPSRQYSGPEEIAQKFLATHRHAVESACFGIAGPVTDGRCHTPNLPWIVDSRHIAAELGIETVQLVNDLEANAHGIAMLKDSDFITLNAGQPSPSGNRGLISAGTGLGEAGLLASPAGYVPFPSEGGHVEFAPRNELEIELLRHLTPKFGHVSYERVLSGPGLYNIYQFLRDTGRGSEPPWLAELIASGDPSAAIAHSGLEETCELCVHSLNMFGSIYGAEAGNFALKVVATGGMFVGGGIAPKIIKTLSRPEFMHSFSSKGRVSPLLENIPVRVITNDKTALLGAGRVAALAAAKRRARAV
jgi:glucokinase